MSTQEGRRPGRSIRNWLSLALFGLAAILFIVVAVIYIRDQTEDEPELVPPTARPGKAELKTVIDALRAQGVAVEVPRQGGARIELLTPPGQVLTVDGNPLYVFIYEDPATREEETADLESAELRLVSPFGTPIAGGTPHAIGGSNVYAVLLGGDAALAATVDRTIGGLP